jgi:hypothetical protein
VTIIQDGTTTETISSAITSADGANIIIVVNNDQAAYKTRFGITETTFSLNGFVDEVYCFAKLKNSLAEAPPIQFLATDTKDDRTAKAVAYEWSPTNPRIEMCVWSRKNPGTTQSPTPWNLVGSTSLMNPAGYPWRRYRLLDLLTDNLGRKLGPNGQIGVSLKDVGFGLIKSSEDVITIDGAYSQECVIFTPTNPNIFFNNYNWTIGTTKANLLEANELRSAFNITNTSLSQTLYLDYSPNVSTTVFTAALTPGQNHQGASGYKGIVSVVGSTANTRLTAREASL